MDMRVHGLRGWVWLIAAALLLGLSSGVATAQDSAADSIEPRVTRVQFAALCQNLALDKDQRSIAELAFGDYASTVDDLAKRLDQQAVQAGRQTAQDALAGKSRIAPDELKRIRIAVLKVYAQGWPEADEALTHLLQVFEGILTREQTPAFDAAVRELRRQILLHPRQASADFKEYAGDGVDVLLLAQDARESGGELAELAADALNEILAEYEDQLDATLVQNAGAYRQVKLDRKIALIDKNAAAVKEHDQAALAQWKQLYTLNKSTVERIAALAETSISEQARDRWLDRFDRACFEWLYPRKKPDRQIEWIRQQSLSADKLYQAETTYENYLEKRRALSRQAIDLMLRGRLEFQTMLNSMMDPPGVDDRVRRSLYDELLKNSGEQANLESSTAAELESLLSTTQRDALRDAMKRPDAQSPSRRK